MKLRVRTTPDADEMISDLDGWWRENRPDTASLVIDELERVFNILSERPYAGRPHLDRSIPRIRKYRLQKTPYLLYYVPNVEAGEIVVLAVWSAMRKRGPFLKAP